MAISECQKSKSVVLMEMCTSRTAEVKLNWKRTTFLDFISKLGSLAHVDGSLVDSRSPYLSLLRRTFDLIDNTTDIWRNACKLDIIHTRVITCLTSQKKYFTRRITLDSRHSGSDDALGRRWHHAKTWSVLPDNAEIGNILYFRIC